MGVYKVRRASAGIKNEGDFKVADLQTSAPSSTETGGGSEAAATPAQNRSAPGNPIHFSNMRHKETVLPNGIKLVVFTVPDSGLISINGAIKCGFAQESPDKHGVSQVNTALMNSDSKKISRRKSLILQSNLGLSREDLLRFNTEAEHVTFTCNSPRESLKTLVKLISHHVRFPSISDAKLALARKKAIETAKANYELSRDKLKDHLLRKLLAKDSPYGPVQINNLIADLEKVSPEDLSSFRKKTVNPSEMTLVATGDITIEEFKKVVQSVFFRLETARRREKSDLTGSETKFQNSSESGTYQPVHG